MKYKQIEEFINKSRSALKNKPLEGPNIDDNILGAHRQSLIQQSKLMTSNMRKQLESKLEGIQSNLGDDEPSTLKRFKLICEIIYLTDFSDDHASLIKEFTIISDDFIKEFRLSQNGTTFIEAALTNEDHVSTFYGKLVDIQRRLLKSY